MITFKAIVIPNNKRKDGTYPVKIRVTFKGVSRRLPTNLSCKQGDLARGSYRIKSNDILAKAEEIISSMRIAVRDLSLFELEDRDVDWVVARIKETLKGNSFALDFFEYADKYCLTKTLPTRNAYTCALNTFERFLGKRSIDINDITRTILLDFMEFVDNEKKVHYDVSSKTFVESSKEKIAKGASTRHIMKLAHIYNSAKERYNDEDSGIILIPKSPFSKLSKVFPPSDGQKSVGMETMQKIISAQTDNALVRLALDVFVISFGLMGANLADLYNATPVNDVWVYNRQKTSTRRADKAEMRVNIPKELSPYIERLQDGSKGWWLPRLHNLADNKDYATARINRALKKWCEDNGVPVFTFYASRHTFATLGRGKAKIEKSLLDECLCHIGDYKMADIYAERDWELINEANQKVIDLFTWSQE